jgi:hypothetical protein
MGIKCTVDLTKLENNHIENDGNLYIRPKSGTSEQKSHIHLHLIYEPKLKGVLLTFPDFSSSDMSGFIHNHVNFAIVSTSGEWTFEERPVFHAIATMKASADQVNRQMWKVASIPVKGYFKEEADRIPDQVRVASTYNKYCVLVLELLDGIQQAAGIDLSSLNAGLSATAWSTTVISPGLTVFFPQ